MKLASSGAILPLLCMLTTVELVGQGPARDLSAEPARPRRLALVIGNDTYERAPLQNARNDARAIASALRELDFVVTSVENTIRSDLVSAISAFGKQIQAEDVVFFFYAGHGLQMSGENYLIPIDFKGADLTAVGLNSAPRPGQARRRAFQLSRRAVGASGLQTVFGKAKVSIIVLDACRDNPLPTVPGVNGGLAPMEARGSLIAFATSAGQTASDVSSGSNGLFTQAVLESLRESGVSIRDVFFHVRQRVFAASNGRQFPAVYDGLLVDVVLRPSEAGGHSAPLSSAQ